MVCQQQLVSMATGKFNVERFAARVFTEVPKFVAVGHA